MRDVVTLMCTKCNRRNYTTTRDKKKTPDKLKLKKYCPFDREHTVHRQVR